MKRMVVSTSYCNKAGDVFVTVFMFCATYSIILSGWRQSITSGGANVGDTINFMQTILFEGQKYGNEFVFDYVKDIQNQSLKK